MVVGFGIRLDSYVVYLAELVLTSREEHVSGVRIKVELVDLASVRPHVGQLYTGARHGCDIVEGDFASLSCCGYYMVVSSMRPSHVLCWQKVAPLVHIGSFQLLGRDIVVDLVADIDILMDGPVCDIDGL